MSVRYTGSTLAWTIAGLACAATPSTPDPAPARAAGYLQSGGVVALAALRVAPDVPYHDSLLLEVEAGLSASLEQLGLRVIPPAVYEKRWQAALETVGGIFDSYTGERIERRFDSARASLVKQLKAEHAVRAIVYPDLEVVGAAFENGTARWDGVAQGIQGLGGNFWDVLDALLSALAGEESDPGDGISGTVTATTLAVYVETLDGEELYAGRGGIEVLERYDDGEFFPLDSGGDVRRAREAVAAALEPLRDETERLRQASDPATTSAQHQSERQPTDARTDLHPHMKHLPQGGRLVGRARRALPLPRLP